MQKTERIWLDGTLVPWDQAQVHVLTHTLHYGLGVFEGIRCYEGRDGTSAIFRLREPGRGRRAAAAQAVLARAAHGGLS